MLAASSTTCWPVEVPARPRRVRDAAFRNPLHLSRRVTAPTPWIWPMDPFRFCKCDLKSLINHNYGHELMAFKVILKAKSACPDFLPAGAKVEPNC